MIDRRGVLAAGAFAALPGSSLTAAPEPLFRRLEATTGGKIGVYAHNLDTGTRLIWRADERFVMCSTFKASLAACVLERVDRGHERLDRTIAYGAKDLMDYAPAAKDNLAKGAMIVSDMCKAAVELSDNTCANLLLDSVGGPSALTAFWRRTGDPVSRLDHNEPLLNRSPPGDPHDTTTPAAMAGNLRRFVLGNVLSSPSRERLTDWLIGCRTGANRLRAGLPKAWLIGDKTGNNGKDAAGDLVVAWPKPGAPILVAMYTQGGSPSPSTLDDAFAEVGRAVAEKLST